MNYFKNLLLKFRGIVYILRIKLGIDKVLYINGSETLPAPLTKSEEEEVFKLLELNDPAAKDTLIEHNLRLVVYIAKKFESTGI